MFDEFFDVFDRDRRRSPRKADRRGQGWPVRLLDRFGADSESDRVSRSDAPSRHSMRGRDDAFPGQRLSGARRHAQACDEFWDD